ncbi:peptidyl-tRNA hydrolase [Streptomyces sp. NPDC048718]|uniref:peptidyl-tRNA hydrolase n=1 Tax=Streptomyces sp. NPDC048718 TaxID=3365587 RepID=UPI00371BB5B2
MSSNDTEARDDLRDEKPEFVLPLVVRIERGAPPARTDALETSARAVLTILSDERSLGEGPWAQAMTDWQDTRIRKVVRRARGAEWRKATTLPGITVTGATTGAAVADAAGAGGTDGTGEPSGAEAPAPAPAPAEVRVFPPVPLDGWPKELIKLQVSGTDLDDPAEPGPVPDGAAVLWLNPGLDMSAGKTMAQTGHGAQLLWWSLPDPARAAWRAAGFPLAVRTATPEHWARLTASDLPMVRDAGFTEIAPGLTVVVEGSERYRPLPRLRRP